MVQEGAMRALFTHTPPVFLLSSAQHMFSAIVVFSACHARGRLGHELPTNWRGGSVRCHVCFARPIVLDARNDVTDPVEPHEDGA